MAEYIEREAAISALEKIDRESKVEMTIEDVRSCLRSLPASDVAPVRHGRWIGRLHPMFLIECSVCLHTEVAEAWKCHSQNYCPNCGAKMDEENGE